jgi:hypothetical protein
MVEKDVYNYLSELLKRICSSWYFLDDKRTGPISLFMIQMKDFVDVLS